MQKSDFHMTNFLWNEQQFLHGSCGNQISTWAMWKSDFWSLVQLVISRIFWKCMEIYQWPSLILTHTGIFIFGTFYFWKKSNGYFITKIFPTVRKNSSSDQENLWNSRLRLRICKNFEIPRTIYSNSERSDQFSGIECLFNLFLEVSQTWWMRIIQIEKNYWNWETCRKS